MVVEYGAKGAGAVDVDVKRVDIFGICHFHVILVNYLFDLCLLNISNSDDSSFLDQQLNEMFSYCTYALDGHFAVLEIRAAINLLQAGLNSPHDAKGCGRRRIARPAP